MKKILSYLYNDLKSSFRLEKRNCVRKRIDTRIVFIVISRRSPEKVSHQQTGIMHDLSLRGMSFLVDNLYYEGLHIWKDHSFMEPNFLKVAFLLHGISTPIEAEAEVINFSLAGPSCIKRYKIGVKFLDMDKSSADRIKEFLQVKPAG
jgi:hypothetical protein